MIQYTCGFLFDQDDNVVLVLKNKPQWQAGHLNGIGGKFEPGEDALDCMRREWREEVGFVFNDWSLVCSLAFEDAEVWFFTGRINTIPSLSEATDVGEELHIYHADEIPHLTTVPNLKWLVPDCLKVLERGEA